MKKDTIKVTQRTSPYYKEIKGRVLKYKGESFLVPDSDQPVSLEFFYIRSGSGFNGDLGKNKIQSLEAAIERVGGWEKFIRFLKGATSVERHIREQRGYEVLNRIYRAREGALKKKLGFNIPLCRMSFFGKLSLDVVRLDSLLRVPDGQSTEEFIREKYGEATSKLAKSML